MRVYAPLLSLDVDLSPMAPLLTFVRHWRLTLHNAYGEGSEHPAAQHADANLRVLYE